MRSHRVLAGLLAPISLVVLVIALGVLQYKWVGQASETDRAQLSQSMARRADEFAKEFDFELDRVLRAFRITEEFTPGSGEIFARKLEDYRTAARFPAMVKAAYYVETAGDALKLHQFDPAARAFSEREWPASLALVRSRLHALSARSIPVAPTGAFTFQTVSIFPDVPAAVIPESDIPQLRRLEATARQTIEQHAATDRADAFAAGGTYDVIMAPSRGRNHVIIEFDPRVIVETVLPTLAARHFEDSGADHFRVAIVNYRGEPVLSRGVPAGETLTLKNADARSPFFRLLPQVRVSTATTVPLTGGRGGSTTTWQAAVPGNAVTELQVKTTATPPAGAGGALGRGNTAVLVAPPADADRMSMVMEHATGVVSASAVPRGWTVMVQHGAGSLDAAVGRARRRNLYLSFGILGVLAASAMLVMVNARRSEKLAAQQMDFVATVSHELRTPLAVIRSAAQNLSAGVVGEPAQARRYGELIESEGRRLTDMVEQVLEYAGISGNRRPPASRSVDLHDVVRDVVATSQSLPEAAGIRFDVRSDDSLPMVMADEDATRRALLNLVGNAVKYAADGGWIGVSASRGAGRDEGYVQVSVADKGRGIPAEELAHIFEPFYRGQYARDRQIHGNGLGLSLVKRIAESHGGRVTVRSAPGEGTTFVFALPVASSVVAGTPSPATPMPVRHAGGSTT